LALILLCLAPPDAVAAQAVPPPVLPPDSSEDIVVIAPRGPRPALLDPVSYLAKFCVDPARRTRRFLAPDNDRAWEPLDEAVSARFTAGDPNIPTFGLADPARGHTLLLKFETLAQPGRLTERRCTLVVIGGNDHAMFPNHVSKLLRAPGTQRHVGHADGVPRLSGWSQWLWSGMPSRGSKRWVGVTAAGAARALGTWLVVVTPTFWTEYDYIAVDLKTRQGGVRAVSVLTFSWVTGR